MPGAFRAIFARASHFGGLRVRFSSTAWNVVESRISLGQGRVPVAGGSNGGVAQLGERSVRNAKVRGSTPLTST